jgi:hypothetical protein
MKPKCVVCGSQEGVRVFAITVDRIALDMQPVFCSGHGNEYLLRAGQLLGKMMTGK